MASTDARSHVEQLIDDCRRGKPLQALADFLMRTCPPSPQGWLVSMIFGSSACAAGVYLEQTVVPGRTRLGLFAFGPGGYRYLSRRRSEVEALLDADARPIDDYSPSLLAQFFLDTLANLGPYTHALIVSPAQISAGAAFQGFDPRGLDRHEWERCKHLVTAPTCSGDEHRGWTLEFFTLYGWMHDKRTLCRLRYRIRCAPGGYRRRPTGFRIEERVETLSERLRSAPL